LSTSKIKAAADLAQGMRSTQLTEENRDKLAPAGEAPGLIFGFVVTDSLFKFAAWEKL